MTQPRTSNVSLQDTPYHHSISRCMSRDVLCSDDRYSDNNFDHRKPWLLPRLKLLEEVFAIDIAAYSVMSDHHHVVLHVDQTRGRSWGRDEVIRRWLRLYKGDPLVHRHLQGKLQSEAEYRQLDRITDTWRERLTSISEFMRCINEYMASRANREDDCKGRLWEGRFKSQPLLDEAALMSCMAYVDLNPVRAGLSKTLEGSDFTSIQTRIRRVTKGKREGKEFPVPELMPFRAGSGETLPKATLPFDLKDYLELVEWTGQIAR